MDDKNYTDIVTENLRRLYVDPEYCEMCNCSPCMCEADHDDATVHEVDVHDNDDEV